MTFYKNAQRCVLRMCEAKVCNSVATHKVATKHESEFPNGVAYVCSTHLPSFSINYKCLQER
jgi:hypothetical protein